MSPEMAAYLASLDEYVAAHIALHEAKRAMPPVKELSGGHKEILDGGETQALGAAQGDLKQARFNMQQRLKRLLDTMTRGLYRPRPGVCRRR